MSGDTNEGDHACVGAEGIWEIFVPFQFLFELKTALKHSIFKNKK